MKKKLLTVIGALALTLAFSISPINDNTDSSAAKDNGPVYHHDPGYGDIG